MARGAAAKEQITHKILETFPGSFKHEKEIRIPYMEDGVAGQIKVTLTASKTMVENTNEGINFEDLPLSSPATASPQEQVPNEPSDEEKERLKILLAELGM